MHEASLAHGILRAVLDRVEPGDQVQEIRGWLAETEALDAGSIAMHFRGLARGTPAAAAKLALELVHVPARCRACGRVYPPDHHLTLGPDCGSTEGELLGETGLKITEMDVVRPAAST